MAGEWLKWCKGLTRKREVVLIAQALQINRRHAAGLCMEFWEWADDETTNGRINGVTRGYIDDLLLVPGFAEAMREVGWLKFVEGGVVLVNFSRHNGKTAKSRALTARRMSRLRDATRVTGSVTNRAPRARAEQEQQQSKKREELNPAAKQPPDSARADSRSAAAAGGGGGMPERVGWGDVHRMLGAVWPKNPDKVASLALEPGATPERVAWLIWRARTDKPPPKRRHGFIQAGIEAAWPVDPAWLARWQAERDGLGGAA